MAVARPEAKLKFFEQLTRTRWSAALFIAMLMAFYGVVPLLVNHFLVADPYFVKLAQLCVLACVGIAVGFCLPLLDFQFRPGAKRIAIDSRFFHVAVWGSFVLFLAITLATADAIPLMSAFHGATETQLSQQRGALLKTREGWEGALNYISALFTGVVLPYSLALLFLESIPSRWGAFALFLFYCETSLEKALFFRVVIPPFYLVAQRKIWTFAGLVALLLGCAGLLYVNTVLARGTEPGSRSPGAVVTEFLFRPFSIRKTEESTQPDAQQSPRPPAKPREQVSQTESPEGSQRGQIFGPEFFKASYRPTGALDQLTWRIFAVPIFTAADALRVFDNKLDGHPLWGATSTTLSILFGLERVPFEALVDGYQWGGGEASLFGRSNSVFITEAFVNYGWLGIILFSLFIGQSLRLFYKSNDEAFKSLWLLYVFGLFSGGLLGNLFSTGMALLFFVGLFATVAKLPARHATRVGDAIPGPIGLLSLTRALRLKPSYVAVTAFVISIFKRLCARGRTNRSQRNS